jgi:pyrroline-5-carboxylate reductase
MELVNKSVGFIGPGKMATAIINGIISNNNQMSENINIYGRSPEKAIHLVNKGCKLYKDLGEFVINSNPIFLCIKPQSFDEVLTKLKPLVSNNILFVSIAAGINSSYISENLGFNAKVICCMPNTPLQLGQGATAITRTSNVDDIEFNFVKDIFSSSGIVEVVSNEKLLNTVIPVSGSSPAFIFLLAKITCDYAEHNGLDRNTALKLFSQTLIGSAKMLTNTELNEQQLIDMVSSKGGTTVAALDELRKNNFGDIFYNALDKCYQRAIELGNKSKQVNK